MSLFTDLREMSESALEQLADRFPDLPTPVLAAIGAGDLAADQLAELRDSVGNADVPASLEHLRATAPAQAQKVLTGLPNRAGQVAQSMSPDSVRETVGSYARRVGQAYENLARRGGESWVRTRVAGLLDVTPTAAAGTDPAAGPDHPHLPVDAPAAPTHKPRVPRSQTRPGRTASAETPIPITAAPTVTPGPAARRPAVAKTGTARTTAARPGPARTDTRTTGVAKARAGKTPTDKTDTSGAGQD